MNVRRAAAEINQACEIDEMQFVFSASIGEENFVIRSYTDGILSNKSEDSRPYKHYFTEFHYIFQGSEQITFPYHDRKVELTAGQICIIPREIYHGVVTSPDIKRYCFNMTENLFPEISVVRVIDSEYIRFVMNHCLKVKPIGDRLGVLLLDVFFELLDIVKRTDGKEKPKERVQQDPKWIIEEYLLRHFRDPEGLTGLAARLYLSERQTRNLVKKYCGQDYKTLIIKQRMEFADMLLNDSDRSLEEIAEEVGYRSYSGFYQAYTRYFGFPPSQKRQKQ